MGQSHLLIRDALTRVPLLYHTITRTWVEAPTLQVEPGARLVADSETTLAISSTGVFEFAPREAPGFGFLNASVLCAYLLAVLAIGFWYARHNANADDYFRGGKSIPWWAAGCSIFATMLSSLTFTGVPSKAFAQNWVYALGNFMIPVLAFVAVYLALPFYRRIDATSAYEYFERRFDRRVRRFAATLFALFHVFRMALVLSLTGLPLAIATGITPAQSVLLIGGLSIAYSTAGGISAVIWTDTVQAMVLLLGASIALGMLIAGGEGGLGGFLETAQEHDKLRLWNPGLDFQSHAAIAFWAIVLGSFGQNFASYTADQAVVQRYVTTRDEATARRAIWTNAVLSVPATLLFFGIGTGLFVFYHAHPERLDPTITTDQVLPLFIAREMPIGLAGLLVAAIFAAAQSTVSTSMNSTATVVVTDLIGARGGAPSNRLRAAKLTTLASGVAGTTLGLVFIDPTIKSLFDAFIAVVGMFMGVLGGLFALGSLTKRAHARGAMCGAVGGSLAMFALWMWSDVHPYLYTSVGIGSCVAIGLLLSFLVPPAASDSTSSFESA